GCLRVRRTEPERVARGHRGRLQRRAERRRAHAAPGARRRAAHRRRGRSQALSLGRRLARAPRRRADRLHLLMTRPVTAEVADEHGLTRDEWAKIVQLLGRAPTIEELGVVAVMWSEHCSYNSPR